uniref:Uncharacterized protein n=1 Tax=Rhizophora mucronata TaxID=61149 RepID=A0A2P2NVZ6_RHIMU
MKFVFEMQIIICISVFIYKEEK